ncbi:MAG: hypothetical protein PWR10_1074 [Halanaerobiales bacterium]|nr:hypothetical protein [Halanaerobiales bacterium]
MSINKLDSLLQNVSSKVKDEKMQFNNAVRNKVLNGINQVKAFINDANYQCALNNLIVTYNIILTYLKLKSARQSVYYYPLLKDINELQQELVKFLEGSNIGPSGTCPFIEK